VACACASAISPCNPVLVFSSSKLKLGASTSTVPGSIKVGSFFINCGPVFSNPGAISPKSSAPLGDSLYVGSEVLGIVVGEG